MLHKPQEWRDELKKYPQPSLSLLHTFEAVGRHLSFTIAANELCLTQSAVSRQIRTLEGHLGRKLFIRKHRAIELTIEGRKLQESVTRGLDEIAGGIARLRAEAEAPQITVAASVAFSYYWLMPRLARFSEQHPDIDLRVLATDQNVDLRKRDVDVAVLYGDGFWEGIEVQLLFGECVYPVCSPGYLKEHPELTSPSDFLDQTLLHLDGDGNSWGTVDWGTWLMRQGVSGQPVRRGVRLNSYPMVLQGAEAGRGLALGWSYITDPMIADGRLVCPIQKPLKTTKGYYLGALEGTVSHSAVASFLQWMMTEIESEQKLA